MMDIRLSQADTVDPDDLDEEFDTIPSTKPSDIIRVRYDKLRILTARIQTVLGDFATQGERLQALLEEKVMEKEMDEQMQEIMTARMRIIRYVHGFMESMSLKGVLELGIADILHKHTKPMTIQELAAALPLPTVDMNRLQSLMRYVVHHMGLFTLDNKDGTYGLTRYSECLIQDGESFLAPMILGGLTDWGLGAWHNLSSSIEGGPTAFERHHGMTNWDYLASHPDINRTFNQSQEGNTREIFREIVRRCGSWLFKDIGSLVDVGGGNGAAAKEIVKEFPSIKCSVFDLPQVITSNSNKTNDLEWVEGDMFTSIPTADTLLLKYILHDWSDDQCLKILHRCKEAIPPEGKVIIVEMVLDFNQEIDMSPTLMADMFLMVNYGGRERTREEWESLIHNAGYNKCKITPILPLASLIEAFP